MSAIIETLNLSIGYETKTVMENLNFEVQEGEIFGILGTSGCGKSTLLKTLIGLYQPLAGEIRIFGHDTASFGEIRRRKMLEKLGITYQSGALLGSLNLVENVSLPLEEHTLKSKEEIRAIALEKLKLVELENFAEYLPAEISGGMKKRAGLARALALNPKLLFFDEPSAGLDPISAAELDQLILNLKNKLGATVVLVTHELDSVFAITDRVMILNGQTKGIADIGDARELRTKSKSKLVIDFLNRNGLREK